MDVTGASLGLVLTALPMLVIALAIRMTMGTPVLFRQMRPGFQGLPFEILKFRTMRCPADGLDEFDEARLTRLGRFLRSLEPRRAAGALECTEGRSRAWSDRGRC